MPYRPCKNPDCRNFIEQHDMRKFCSNKCRQHAYRLRKAYMTKNHDPLARRPCQNCGTWFIPVHTTHAFCKTSCRVSFWQQMKRIDEKEKTNTPMTNQEIHDTLDKMSLDVRDENDLTWLAEGI